MPTRRRSILSQVLVTTLTAVTAVALYLYLARPRQERFEQSHVQRHMDRTISVNFQDARLDDAFRTLSEQAGISIVVDLPTLAPIPIMHDQKVTLTLNDVPARAALDVLLKQIANDAPILWTERDDHALVSDPSVLTPAVRIYDVNDLLDEYVAFRNAVPNEPYTESGQGLFMGPTTPGTRADLRGQAQDELLNILTQFVDINSWVNNGGAVGHIAYSMNRLFIGQTLENHDQIQRLLAAMRARGPARTSASPESRNHP